MKTETLSRNRLKEFQDASRKVVLVVEDDLSLQPVVRRMFRKLDPDTIIDWATDVDNALTLIEARPDGGKYDLILADVFLDGEESGLDLARECKSMRLDSPLVLTSGNCLLPRESRDYSFLAKPFTFENFRRCIGPAFSARQVEALPAHRKNWFWPVVGLLIASLIGIGVVQRSDVPQVEYPRVIDYDLAKATRWASPWEHPRVKVRLALLFNPRSELNVLISDPMMLAKMERSQRAGLASLWASRKM